MSLQHTEVGTYPEEKDRTTKRGCDQ